MNYSRELHPDRPCVHPEFEASVAVGRIVAEGAPDDSVPIAYSADITVNCAACGEPFRWNGVLAGLSSAEPRCSVDETELRAPLRPASADPRLRARAAGLLGDLPGGVVNPSDRADHFIRRISDDFEHLRRSAVDLVAEWQLRVELAELDETYAVLRAKRGCRR